MLAVEFYNVVLALHILGVVFAFGIVLAYPVLVPWARKAQPSAMPVVHLLQARVSRTVIGPGMVFAWSAGSTWPPRPTSGRSPGSASRS